MIKRLDTYLKFNVALTLSSDHMSIVDNGICCLTNALLRARGMPYWDVFWGSLNEKPLCGNIIYVQGIASPTDTPDARNIGNKTGAKKTMEK